MADIAVNAALVAELRRETGAGMMDCKKALTESGGDKDKALEYLRKKGIAAAEKRADRSAAEGIVAIAQSADGMTAALIELNSETDFVAKNDLFRQFGQDVAKLVLDWADAAGKDAAELKAKSLPSKVTVGDALTELVGKIGEKLDVGRFARMHAANGYVGSYIHSDTKLGVLVELEGITAANSHAYQLGRDLAMQVAASSPTVVTRDQVPAEKIASERAVETERARTEGKPEAALPKIVEGRLNKWFADVALMEQPFVKDPKVVIKDLVAETAKQAGVEIQVKSFVRIRVGA